MAMRGTDTSPITGASAEPTRAIGADGRIAGRVKFYDAIKSYGYIVAESGEEYFFNDNCFRGDAPRKGDRVEFQPERGPKGLMAKRWVVGATA